MRVQEAIDSFMESHFAAGQRASATRLAYACDLRQLRAFIGPLEELRDVGPDILEDWIAELHEARYG